jgi:hypothetical protein
MFFEPQQSMVCFCWCERLPVSLSGRMAMTTITVVPRPKREIEACFIEGSEYLEEKDAS